MQIRKCESEATQEARGMDAVTQSLARFKLLPPERAGNDADNYARAARLLAGTAASSVRGPSMAQHHRTSIFSHLSNCDH